MNALPPVRLHAGIHADVPAAVYHADPCETPSLSAGMIDRLIRAPAMCREQSSRLNTDYAPEDDAGRFSIGTVSHIMFLEPDMFDQMVVVVQADDWRGKAAKEARSGASANGKTAILGKHMDRILAARDVFMQHPIARHAFVGGKTEQTMIWRHPATGLWCRARPDFLADSGRHVCDYKATANADPAEFGRHAYNLGYHRRAAWYLEGCEILLGRRPDHYWFVNQEVAAPHLISVVELDYASLAAGKAQNDLAAERFAECLRNDDWYGYRHAEKLDRDSAFQVGIPSWAHAQIEQTGAL